MQYNTTIKQKNLAGVSIAGLAFKGLREAETYCAAHGIEPNAISDDPGECRDLAGRALPELEYIRELLDAAYNAALGRARSIAEQMEQKRGQRGIMADAELHVLRENHLRATGALDALTEFNAVLVDRNRDLRFLRSVARMASKPVTVTRQQAHDIVENASVSRITHRAHSKIDSLHPSAKIEVAKRNGQWMLFCGSVNICDLYDDLAQTAIDSFL